MTTYPLLFRALITATIVFVGTQGLHSANTVLEGNGPTAIGDPTHLEIDGILTYPIFRTPTPHAQSRIVQKSCKDRPTRVYGFLLASR